MAINIQSLFSDIIETPAQRQQRMLTEGILKGRELTGGLTGLARTQAPLVSALAMQMPQRQEAMRRGVGGILGLDVRTESEKVQDILRGADTSDPQGLRNLARELRQIAPTQSMALLQAANERETELAKLSRQEQLENLQIEQLKATAGKVKSDALAQQRYRDYVAGLAEESTKFAGFAPGIKDGSVPESRLQKIVDELTEKVDPKQLTLVQAYVDGQHMTLNTDGFGNFFKMDGSTIELGAEDKVATASATGAFEDVAGISQERKEGLQDKEISTRNFVNSANNVIQMLREEEDINTFVAKFAGTADDLIQEGAALWREISPEVSTNIESYKGVFDGLGIESSRFRSATFGLALQYAAASGLGEGRSLTDADIERAIRAIGSDRSDPEAIIAVLTDKKREIVDRFKGAYSAIMERPYEVNLDPFATRPSDSVFE